MSESREVGYNVHKLSLKSFPAVAKVEDGVLVQLILIPIAIEHIGGVNQGSCTST